MISTWNNTSCASKSCAFTGLFFIWNIKPLILSILSGPTRVEVFDLPEPYKCVAMVCDHWVLRTIMSFSCRFQLKPAAWNQFPIIWQLQQKETDLKVCQIFLWVTEITTSGNYHHDLVKQLISYPIINPSGLGGVLLRVITFFFG